MAIVLVADDHPINRHFLATLLTYEGHEVREAADGLEALESVRAAPPDLLIVDVAMPRMDGFEFVREIKSDPKLAFIPIIFYTATYREVESRAVARAAGVEHVITKPSDPELVLRTVRAALKLEPAPTARPRAAEGERLNEYLTRLEQSNIRMGALVELSLELNGERDADRLIRTACRGVRNILGADEAALVILDEQKNALQFCSDGTEEPLQEVRVNATTESLVPELTPRRSRRASGEEPLVVLLKQLLPATKSVLVIALSTFRGLYGWLALSNRDEAKRFSDEDERLALTAASEIAVVHENLMLNRTLRQQAMVLTRAHEDLESRIGKRTRELTLAGEALRGELTQREQIERDLRESQERMATLVDAAPVAIFSMDTEGIIRAWNRAAERIFGWRAEEVLGGKNPLVPAENEPEYRQLLARCAAGEVLSNIEVERQRKDGARLTISLSAAPLHGAGGKLTGFIVVLSDITDRKRAESELRRSREELRALSARVIAVQEEERTRISRELHDGLGQLLTAIKIDVSRLLQEIGREVKPSPKLTEGLLKLIDETIDTSTRIVSELRPTRLDELGLQVVIEKKIREFEERTGIECELSIQPEDLDLKGDLAIAIFRIFEEALTNVARHSDASRAEVRLRETASEYLMEIRDNGRGIRDPEQFAANAFGLIGMKERAHVFGGNVRINGVAERGTIVTVRIPREGSAAVAADFTRSA